MDVLSNMIVQEAKEALKRIFLETLVRHLGVEAARAVVKDTVSTVKKVKQRITRWCQWEIVGIEIEVTEGA